MGSSPGQASQARPGSQHSIQGSRKWGYGGMPQGGQQGYYPKQQPARGVPTQARFQPSHAANTRACGVYVFMLDAWATHLLA
eukprot:364298-Chlamydomonas_euryale.AAC.16